MKGTAMETHDSGIYRRLQRHLDAQAVGFPETGDGADARLLKTLFTPEEAAIALRMSYRPRGAGQILADSEDGSALEAMFLKGLIARREKDGEILWRLMPLVVGMFEAVGQDPSPRKLGAMLSYMRREEWMEAMDGTRPSQMRTIPIHASIKVEHHVAGYDDAREILRKSEGPFAVLPCICRELSANRGNPCSVATLKESCLGIGDGADMLLRRGRGRQIGLDEALAILAQNEADGLVLQPANAKDPEFICSCCGCCCGMLGGLKSMEHPLDYWTTSYQAVVDPGRCSACGLCESRCQVGAMALDEGRARWRADVDRCIGCGLCVSTCPSEAISLHKREPAREPPEDSDRLYEAIVANRAKGRA